MSRFVKVVLWIVRLTFLVSLVLGIILWTGHGYEYLKLHMWLGFVITFALLALVVLSLLARVRPVLPLIALLWAVALPVLGIAQLKIVPGANHWTIQVIHALLGVGAIGLAEVLGKRASNAVPSELRPI